MNLQYVTKENQLESIKSMQSTIRKLENAFSQMTEKGANTTTVKKRLDSCKVGLAILEHVWHGLAHIYSQSDLEEARQVLSSLIPSIESSYVKSKAGSPQRTLLERRLKALQFAEQAIAGQISSK